MYQLDNRDAHHLELNVMRHILFVHAKTNNIDISYHLWNNEQKCIITRLCFSNIILKSKIIYIILLIFHLIISCMSFFLIYLFMLLLHYQLQDKC